MTALAVLLVLSGFFSLAETAMMAANRLRLKHRAQRGSTGARTALHLLAQTDRLLGVILLGNNLINAAAATLTAVLTERLFGEGRLVLAAGTVAITFLILVFSEVTPKVVGAYADRIAPVVSITLAPLLKLFKPAVWFVNLFVQGLLKLARIQTPKDSNATLSQEEIRTLVLEGNQYFRGKHRAMLANLFDLDGGDGRGRDGAAPADPRARPGREAAAPAPAAGDELPHARAGVRGARPTRSSGSCTSRTWWDRCRTAARSTPRRSGRSCASPISCRRARRS